MSQYDDNLRAWWVGFRRFGEIHSWKDGWGPTSWGWKALYAIDYLACALILAGPVVSVSWYLGAYWGVEGYHFANAGKPLWGTTRCAPWVRLVVPAAWVVGTWSLVKLIRLALA
jgi:hypothetical protein